MRCLLLGSFICSTIMGGLAYGQTCQSWPTTLTNGQAADASQVMGNFTYLAGCAAPLANAHLTGSVGIGTTSPFDQLVVYNSTNSEIGAVVYNNSTQPAASARFHLAVGAPNAYMLSAIYQNSGTPYYQLNTGPGVVNTYFSLPNFNFQSATGTEWMSINSSGQVSVGGLAPPANTPSYAFYVYGTAGGNGAWSVSSDARLKKDIVQITDALSLVERLRGVRYRWRPPSEREIGKTLPLPVEEAQIGFIAQEVEAVVPEAVNAPKPGSDGIYSLKESKLIPILVEAIKQQEASMKTQEAEIAEMRAEIAALKAKK